MKCPRSALTRRAIAYGFRPSPTRHASRGCRPGRAPATLRLIEPIRRRRCYPRRCAAVVFFTWLEARVALAGDADGLRCARLRALLRRMVSRIYIHFDERPDAPRYTYFLHRYEGMINSQHAGRFTIFIQQPPKCSLLDIALSEPVMRAASAQVYEGHDVFRCRQGDDFVSRYFDWCFQDDFWDDEITFNFIFYAISPILIYWWITEHKFYMHTAKRFSYCRFTFSKQQAFILHSAADSLEVASTKMLTILLGEFRRLHFTSVSLSMMFILSGEPRHLALCRCE